MGKQKTQIKKCILDIPDLVKEWKVSEVTEQSERMGDSSHPSEGNSRG